MKKLIVVAVLALGATSAVAKDMAGPGGCSLIGSYITTPGSSDPQWLSTSVGQSSDEGVGMTDVPAWPNVTLFGLVPTAVRVTTLRGAWVRTGGNTFAFTQIGFGVDAGGNTLYVVRNSGTQVLTNRCSQLAVDSTLEFFEPDAVTPLRLPTGEPVVLKLDVMKAFRVVVQPAPTDWLPF